MTIHVIPYTAAAPHAKQHPQSSFAMEGLSLEQFRQIHGGDWCALPSGYFPHLPPGFQPWKTQDGTVVAVKEGK